MGYHVLNQIATLALCVSVTGLIGRNIRAREVRERLQGNPVIHFIKGKTDTEAGEFDQVTCAIVILPPESALTSVDLNCLVFAANEHIFLNGRQRLVGFEFGPAVALLGCWGEHLDHHGWISEHGASLLATGHQDIWVEVAFLGEFHAGVTGVGSARLAPQRTNEQIAVVCGLGKSRLISGVYPEPFELRSSRFDGFKTRQIPESTNYR